ncbi:MAG: hypothetical protein JXB32_23235 [Deltaproteobacteria bacterium]|nr:hypothetical protein [Deltaproteobacteria bacterium]
MAACAVLSAGCYAQMNTRLQTDLRRRAAFDLGCPPDGMEMVVLSRIPTNREIVSSYGIYGCGRQATYVLDVNSATWVLNSRTGDATMAGQPGAASWQPAAAQPVTVPAQPVTAPAAVAAPPEVTVVVYGPPEPAATEPPALAPDLPDSPSRADVQGALEPLREAVRACVGEVAATVRTDVEFRGPTGRVNKVTVTTTLGADAAACLGQALLGAVVPPFAQPTLLVRYPWNL